MRFRSLPIEIEAVQFIGPGFKTPAWLTDTIHQGKAMMTINSKDQYVTIFGRNSSKRAYPGDWICTNDFGNIFVLSDEEISNGFEEVMQNSHTSYDENAVANCTENDSLEEGGRENDDRA